MMGNTVKSRAPIIYDVYTVKSRAPIIYEEKYSQSS